MMRGFRTKEVEQTRVRNHLRVAEHGLFILLCLENSSMRMRPCKPDDESKTSVACTRSGVPPAGAKTTTKPAGVYDLKHAKLRESGTESHKFYLKMPQNVLVTLKTETPYAQLPTARDYASTCHFLFPAHGAQHFQASCGLNLIVKHLFHQWGAWRLKNLRQDDHTSCGSRFELSFAVTRAGMIGWHG
jgi:hypothetical protein